MARAIRLAKKAKGLTFPNPSVGAVVVNHNTIVGEAATDRYGGLHAEPNALLAAGDRSQGATLYVTLEPCNHFGKTPPCTHAIVKAGIQRVVVALSDPNPLVNGSGIAYLRAHAIKIDIGLMEREAFDVNEDFFFYIQNKRPWITLKLALTLDGYLADINHTSKWITNQKSRAVVHELRRKHSAVVIGRNTLEKDNPQLTVRLVKGKSPDRIVITSQPTMSLDRAFRLEQESVRRIIACTRDPIGHKSIDPDGIEVWNIGSGSYDRVIQNFLQFAFQENFCTLLVEGGQILASTLLENQLVNRIYIFYGNKLFGDGYKGIQLLKPCMCNNAIHLMNQVIKQYDDTLMVTGIPCWS